MMALVQVQPDDVDMVFAMAEDIVQDLATNGPTADELQRVVEPVRQGIFRAQTGHTFWLNRIEGGTQDPLRLANLPNLAVDYLATTPDEMRALAQRYLADDRSLKIAVLPQE